MDRNLYAIYEELSDRYQYFQMRFGQTAFRRILADVGDEVLIQGLAKKPLRPDAKLFLLINLTEMVVIPVLDPRNQRKVDENELRAAIRDDVRMLVATADEDGRGNEISSGDILRAVASHWDRLRINQIRFWGARDDAERG